MDLYSREPGPQYVTTFAGRLLLSMAKGIVRATGDMKRALLEKDVQGMWTLALVVVQWYADALPKAEAKVVEDTLREFDIASLASNLNLFHDLLTPFVKAAHEARSDTQLAPAGVYFLATVDQLGLSLLSSAMKSGAVSALERKLKVSLPLPDELKASYYRTLSGQPPGTRTSPATPSLPSRGERFERADFAPRLAQPKRPVTQGARAEISPVASSPPRLTQPNLETTEVARAYLHTLGWEEGDVDRLLRGPEATVSKRRT